MGYRGEICGLQGNAMSSENRTFEEAHKLELLNGRTPVLLLAIDFLFSPGAEMSMETGIVSGCQLQFDLHGDLAVIHKEGVGSHPAIQHGIALQFIEKECG